MKRSLTFLGVILFLNGGLLFAKEPSSFCVQSFNTYGPVYSTDLKRRTKALADYLKKESKCKVIQLQEVWREKHVKDLSSQISQARPELAGLYFDELRGDEVMTGLMSWTSGEPQEVYSQVYENNDGGGVDWIREALGIKKSFGYVKSSFRPSSQLNEVYFYNTHLHHSSQSVRMDQLLELARGFLDPTKEQAPVVLTGDFNFEPDTLEWRFVRDVVSFKDAYHEMWQGYSEEDCTYCQENPRGWGGGSRVIDYIFYRPSLKVDFLVQAAQIKFKKFLDVFMSDHYGVEAQFLLKNKGQAPMSKIGFQMKVNEMQWSVWNLLDDIEESFQTSEQPITPKAFKILKNLRKRIQKLDPKDPIIQHWVREL